MKRYEYEPDPYGECACSVIKKDDGEWVKADIAEELYEVVSELSCYKDSPVPNTLIDFADKLAKKVREGKQ